MGIIMNGSILALGSGLIALIVFGSIAVIVILWVVGAYNGLITARNRFKNAFAQIDVQLKRRYDLIPNLVETAKGYIKHERETLEAVIAARNTAASAAQQASSHPEDGQAIQGLMAAEGTLTGAMGRLFALMESYPDLKANQNMMQVSEELTSTENKISFARQAFNDSATSYNTTREKFPTNMIAGMFNFAEAQLWEIEEVAEREAVKVEF